MITDHNTGTSEIGSVVLDIGGDLGAAIVHTSAALAGSEIEIRSTGTPWDGTHVAVRPRHIPNGLLYAAVFPGLKEGTYEVRVRGASEPSPRATLAVEGGHVAETRL